MAKKTKKEHKKKSALPKISKSKLARKVEKLQQALHIREDYISHLERLSEAYENLKRLSDTELKDADNIIQAQEIIQSLMTEERIHAEKIIRAHEVVNQLSAQEIDEARKIIEAQEKVQGLMSQERMEAEEIIQAHEIVETLSAQEIEDAYKTIEAHEKIHGLSSLEQRNIEQEIDARVKVSELSTTELMHKDQDLLRVLEINRAISAILDEEELLRKIVDALAGSLSADRAVFFRMEESRLKSKARFNITEKDIHNKSFTEEKKVIDACSQSRSSQLVLHQQIESEKESEILSMIAVPLIYHDRLLGVLYADKKGLENTLYSRDQFIAEIFAQQAVISLNNAFLYKKLKKQNWELLRLINLKNEFVSRLSLHLIDPCKSLDKELNKLSDCEHCTNSITKSRMISKNLSETVSRVLSLVEIEKEVDDLISDKVDFLQIIELIKKKYTNEISKKHLDIQIDMCEEFKSYPGNSTIIRAILDELVGNAILYNKDGGRVSITGKVKGEYLDLKIADTGMGIEKKEQELIFEQFYRSEKTSNLNTSGAGLGLYMVRSFMTYYHGKLDLESTPGKGSTFILSLLAK